MGIMGLMLVCYYLNYCYAILRYLLFDEGAATGPLAPAGISCLDAFLFVLYWLSAEGEGRGVF